MAKYLSAIQYLTFGMMILPNDLHKEGGVSFRKGKKPEKLFNEFYNLGLMNMI